MDAAVVGRTEGVADIVVPVATGEPTWSHGPAHLAGLCTIACRRPSPGLSDAAAAPSCCAVSGRHARLEQKDGKMFVTDLDSTNGTFLGGRKLRPGAVTQVDPGNVIVFGDEHLAQFLLTEAEIEA
eukprot:SM000148S01054  [mRNA]  locus=s148:344070:344748:- [translate_table: standard]